MAAEWFEGVVEGEVEAACCRGCFVVHCFANVSDRFGGGRRDWSSVIRSPSTGDEELPLMIPQ